MTVATASLPTRDAIVANLRQHRLVPVIVIDHPKDAAALGRALVEGGLPCAEVTFRTAAAKESIERLVAECPDVLVGAGTVLAVQQVQDAIGAGAKFIVAPGFNPAVADYCIEHSIPVFPGVATPTELEAALSRGLNVLKFFPAQPLGGIQYLKAMSAPYGGVSFIPTGGISLSNLGEYLQFPRVVACGGSWMATPERISAGDFAGIASTVREAVNAVSTIGRGAK